MLRSISSGCHLTPPISLIVPAKSHSLIQTPGVVGLGVVVVVVVVVVVLVVVLVSLASVVLVETALAASRSFSIEIGVVDGVGQPVNSVVALQKPN